MGGKSSSSADSNSTTTTNTENLQASTSGVADNVYQGKDITINDQFSPEVQKAFGSLVDLAEGAGGSALDLAELSIKTVAGVFDNLSGLAESSIAKVSEQTITQSQPQQAALNSLVPVMLFATVAAAIYFIVRKRA